MHEYGVGVAKSLQQLHDELKAGESRLSWSGGALIRSVSVVTVLIRNAQGLVRF